MDAANDPIPTRASLLRRVRDLGDQESWNRFCEVYSSLIFQGALRAGLTRCEAEEVVQETLIAVAKDMPNFVYDPAKGSFKARLMRLARWRIASHFRKRQPALGFSARDPRTSTGTATIERVPDPAGVSLERVWDEEWHDNLLQVALHRIRNRVDPKQYQIFDCHVIKRWTIPRVARALRISRTRVYLARHRIGRMLKKEIARLKQEEGNFR